MLMTSELLSRITLPADSPLSVEVVTRAVLDLLQLHTACESTYLTRIDAKTGFCTVAFSRNTKHLHIPEGTTVLWGETLCKKAMEDPGFNKHVTEVCDTVPAAKALGIKTYAASPIYLGNGELYGTLCAASAEQFPMQEAGRNALTLYAKVIGQHVEQQRQNSKAVPPAV